MRLSRVEYELFESDAERLAANTDLPFHEIDREVHIYTDAHDFYVSWVQTADAWRIAYQPDPFYRPASEIRQDFSSHPIWSPLIGVEFELVEAGEENLALQFLNEHHSVFCCPFENGNWGVNVIHIATKLPSHAT